MQIFDKFLSQYMREVDFYEKSARICADICESELERQGIRAIVTYRVKRFDRLKDKLVKRNERKNYASIEEIYEDIVDLAGVRIAIYFPNDNVKIDRFIKSKFNVREIKSFPQVRKETEFSDKKCKKQKYEKVFSGYHATHYRINLKSHQVTGDESKYSQANIEIQVASVLMHAWAEVEHDMVYKPLSGELSLDEYEILDELNGLILSGELALKRLQKAVKERVRRNGTPFSSHYELAAFIYDKISATSSAKFEDITMGRADVLFKFLKKIKLNKPECMEKYIRNVDPQCEKSSVVEQIVAMIVENDPKSYKIFLEVKNEMASRNPYSNANEKERDSLNKRSVLYFIDKMADLQLVMKKYIAKHHPEIASESKVDLDAILMLLNDININEKLKNIKSINSEMLHGNALPPSDKLIEEGKNVEFVIDAVLCKFDPEERKELEDKVDEIDISVD